MRNKTRRNTRRYHGGRGGMGMGANVGHAYTTGATQELSQMKGIFGGKSGYRRRNRTVRRRR
jgi:hypothetical protein